MGCYVGLTDDPSTYSECPAAYESSVIGNAMFVRCVDQDGQTLNLDAEVATAANTQGSPLSSSAIKGASLWLLAVLLGQKF